MAIEVKYDSEFVYSFDKSYAKIENIRTDTARDEIWIDVRFYANETARKDTASMGVGKKTFKYKLNEIKIKSFDKEEITTACYEKLKTENIFKLGKDV